MRFQDKKYIHKIVLSLTGIVFLFSFLFSAFFPDTAYAIGGVGDQTNNIDITPPNTPNQQYGIWLEQKLQKIKDTSLASAFLSAAVQSASYFSNKLAYDAAQYVANGGKGQFGLIFTSNWYKYVGQVGGDAVGSFVADLGSTLGLDLCHFPRADLQLYLQLSLRQAHVPSTDCSWNDLTNAYGKQAWIKRYNSVGDTADRFSSQDKLLKEFGKAVRPGNSDFGVSVGAIFEVDRIKGQQEQSALAERQTNGGFKDLTDAISGNVKTPGQAINEETIKQTSAFEKDRTKTISMAGIYASGFYQIIPQTASMFLNTLGATLLQKLFTQGLVSGGGNDSLAYDYGSDPGTQNSLESAQNAYNFLFAHTPVQAIDYNDVAEFASCPDNPGINNCVMDTGLQDAISRSSPETPITIGEALKQGLLNPNWPLISPRRIQDNQNIKGCVSEKYCYSNIQKLRKARILPLGFEIAALRSDPDHPWILGEVVAGFDSCNRPDPNNPSVVVPDPNYPFCHLINPNWVIKAPESRCDIKSFGDALIDPQSSSRREECVDVSTCLAHDETGACSQFGYCTKESNTWSIGADSCPAQYNTCTTYTNAETHKIVSYLAKTVDYGECTADNVGCRAYSLAGIGNLNAPTTSWQNSSAATQGQVIFFNEKIKDVSNICSEKNDGCSAFYGATRLNDGRYLDLDTTTPPVDFAIDNNNLEHIKKAPDYLGCYDANVAPGIQWPSTVLEAATAEKHAPACDKFASACVPEEVGCEAFKPADGGPTIPGKIGDNNYCAQVCVGYETFKQEPSAFEAQKFPVYFIPDQAKSCPSTANGCSEFTNIDTQAHGGEGLEYYTDLKYCEKPNHDDAHPNVKTFYSWEGSFDNGYVLRTYQMKPLDAAINGRVGFGVGSPAYILDTNDALNDFIGKCDELKYNNLLANKPDAADPDCRALFDKDGHTYYRLLAKTVTVDESCHPLRKTEPVFVRDPSLAGKNQCIAASAHWNEPNQAPGFCERCINGGKYQNGFCIYQTISDPSESTSCQGPASNPGQYNGCRAYTGNAVSNIKDVFHPGTDDFEPTGDNADAFTQALQNWTSVPADKLKVVAESIHTGQHSMQVVAGTSAIRGLGQLDVEPGQWYELSFLAKSNAALVPLRIQFNLAGVNGPVGAFATDANPVRIGSSWQLYTVGPIQFTGATSTGASISFARSAGNDMYFLDQVRLRRINDYQYYIKDSWKQAAGNDGHDVPLACDSAPEDTLPGEALGCRQYTDSQATPRYATGFQNLCREKAIACQPVWDTFNTVTGPDATKAQAFNVECTGAENTTCRAVYQNQELGSCFIAVGATYCYIPQITMPDRVSFAALQQANNNHLLLSISSVFVPSDTPTTTPIFLALGEAINGKPKYACDESETGCQKAGQEERHLPNAAATSFSFNDLFVKNDPESYKDTLCRSSLVGCSHYQSGSKETFFRDPEITGNSLCSYKPQTNGVSSQYGWFLNGVGKCTTALAPQQIVGAQLCSTDTDCPITTAGNVQTQQHCVNIGTVACSEDNLRVGGFYDIWSNKSPNYHGNVGICPAEANSCTEIIDRQDTSNVNPDGKPYYVLFNDKIEQKKKQCTQVSLSEGCVLFDKTDEPNKVFDSKATYTRSEKRPDQPFGPVEPARSGDADFQVADTNLLMKVNRDRECSEWLACKSYASAVTYEGGARHETQICAQLAACDKVGVGGTCDNWVDSRTVGGNAALNRLTYDKYMSRSVSWYSPELSGYSLYNKYQIGDMIYLKFNFEQSLQGLMQNEMNQTYIARQLRQNIFDLLDEDQFDCKPEHVGDSTDWKTCGFGDNQVNGGRCYANRCVYPIDGSFPTNIDVNGAAGPQQKVAALKQLIGFLEPNSCKGVPESDSPYSNKILKVGIGEQKLVNPGVPGERTNTTYKLEGFTSANVCQAGACSCAYQKVQYGLANVDYWPLFGLKPGTVIPEGVCSGGGKKDALPCTQTADCVDDKGTATTEDDEFGQCNLRQNAETRIGLEGYCLEEDRSRPIFYNGQNSFACLTWLPVNISASAVDIYNTDVSAGYNLKDDASVGGGEVMCASSTAVGTGVYDRQAMTLVPDAGHTLGEKLDQIYPYYFYSNGEPNMDGYKMDFAGNYDVANSGHFVGLYQNYSCVDSVTDVTLQLRKGKDGIPPVDVNAGQSLYIRAICDETKEATSTMSNMIYSWLHKQAIPDATLLRIELGLTEDEHQNLHHHWDDWGNDFDPDEDHTDRRIFSFAPSNSGIDPTDEETNIREFGTIMHMPRTFDNTTLSESNTYLPQMDLVNPPENMLQDQDAKVHVGGYGVADESGTRGGRLYRSNFERYMHENDLSKIYFLILDYPGGAKGGLGAGLMQKDYAIDFDRLRKPGVNPADATLLLDVGKANEQFSLNQKNQRDTVLWTYKLDNVSQSAFAFNDYSHFKPNVVRGQLTHGVEDYITGSIGERNRIQTRYVAVWSDWIKNDNTQTPNFLEQHVPIDQSEGTPGIIRDQVSPADPNSDPFSAPCVVEHANWLAIGMDFNKDGEFLGYIARWCNQAGGGGDDAGAQFAVAASLHDRCTTFDQVYKADGVNPLYDTTNKASTNFVWFGATDPTGKGPRKLSGNPWSDFSIDGMQRPYSSLKLTEQDLTDYGKLRNYSFRSKDQGLPYICSAKWLGGNSIDDTKRCAAMLLIPLDTGFVNRMNAQADPDAALGKIHGLFAKIFSVNTVDNAGYTRGDIFGESLDFFVSTTPQSAGTDSSGGSAYPPKIFALNPSRCEDRDKCGAAEEGNITIGNQNGTREDYNGDGVPDEPDADQNGVTDPIIVPGGTYSAEAKFFAFADDNHMPLRRIMVDWDEEGLPPMNADKRGLYKNRKPMCGTSNQGGPADVGLCATLSNGQFIHDTPTLHPTGVTCSNDKICPTNSICIPPAGGSLAGVKVCGGNDGDNTYSNKICSTNLDCSGATPTCTDISGFLPVSNLVDGAITYLDANGNPVVDTGYQTMRFGNTPRACTTDYFTFVHQYSCGPSNLGTKNAVYVRDLLRDINGQDLNANPKKLRNPYYSWYPSLGTHNLTQGTVDQLKNKYGLRDDDYVCIFKPRVQAEDNWDWCNGKCSNVYNGIVPDPAQTRNACYGNFPYQDGGRTKHVDQCDPGNERSGVSPWSDYNGSIIVIPDIKR